MIYLLKKYNLIFIFTPKCACTTIKNIIAQLEDIKIKNYFDVHSLNFDNLSKNLLLEKYFNYPIIFFKRNPFDRFSSGYSKVTNKLILKFKLLKNINQDQSNKLVEFGNISLENFTDLIINSDPKFLNEHYSPQTYGLEEIFKSNNLYLYDINNLNNFNNFLFFNFGISKKVNIHNKYNLKKNELNNKLKIKLYNYYKNDFLFLNYRFKQCEEFKTDSKCNICNKCNKYRIQFYFIIIIIIICLFFSIFIKN